MAEELGPLESVNPFKPLYTQAEVLRVVKGLKAKDVQNWCSRHLIQLSVQNPGRHAKRLFSQKDIVILNVMKKLTFLGVSAMEAARVATGAASDFFGIYTTQTVENYTDIEIYILEENGKLEMKVLGAECEDPFHRLAFKGGPSLKFYQLPYNCYVYINLTKVFMESQDRLYECVNHWADFEENAKG